MTSKDLMIGDWVQIVPDAPVMPNEYHRIDWIKTGEIGLDNRKIVTYPYIQPIPLTSEILEKNFQEFLPGINLMYQLKGPYCAMNEDGQWVFGLVKVDGENSARYPLVKISFVHELQHALRLCGITKEIQI